MCGPTAHRDAGVMTTRAVDRLLQIFLGLALVPVLTGVAFGLFFIGQDAEQSGEFLDGLGFMIGLGVLVLVGVPGVLVAVALARSLRHRSNATSLALAAGLLGSLSTLVFAFVYPPCVAALVPALLVTGVAVAARRDVSA
jgi:zinc transporter ZupT